MRFRFTRARVLLLFFSFLMAVLLLGLLWFIRGPITTSESDRAAHAAVRYAQGTTLWTTGPTVRTVRIVPLARLAPALRDTVAPRLRADVNVPDLIHRYGPRMKVALVVLHGVYNSLPPDEGVVIRGDVVSLVDIRNNRVLLLTS